MARLISVDPGNNAGVAVWDDGVLVGAMLYQGTAPLVTCLGNETIVEVPRIYPTGKGTGDPNDLIQTAYSAGRLTAGASRVIKVYPYQWKGQVNPEILETRVLATLTNQEHHEVPDLPKSTRHNVTDAIGIGLWYLKRMGVGGR